MTGIFASAATALCGVREWLIDAIVASGVTGPTVASNTAGIDGKGPGNLLAPSTREA